MHKPSSMPKPAKRSETGVYGGIRSIASDGELEQAIRNHGSDRLIVVYFSLTWCGSCQKMNPAVEALATKYSSVLFIQVNADKAPATTKKHHVYKVPVFLIFNNRVRVDRVEGASPSELESKIKRNLADIQYQKQGILPPQKPELLVPQQVKMADVMPYLDKSQCRCINDLTPTPFQAFLEGKKLISGRGSGRMILVYAFTEKMVISALKIKAPVFSAPKSMRFFVNLHKVLDFAIVSQMSSAHELILNEEDLSGDHSIEIKSGGIVGVMNLQIYIPENMTKNRKTEIESLVLIGAPMNLTNYANIEAVSTANTAAESGSFGKNTNGPGPDKDDSDLEFDESVTLTPAVSSHPRAQKAGPSRRQREKVDAFAAT